MAGSFPVKRVQQRPPVEGEYPYQFGLILFLGQRHALPDGIWAAPRVNQILAQNVVGIRCVGHSVTSLCPHHRAREVKLQILDFYIMLFL